ncbi:MAG: hypothetical protein Q7R84_02950 [bacterium]|nr:hypothetical protein [bacterium]
MSTQFLTQAISEKIGFPALPKINIRKMWALGLIPIAAILVFYIFQISEITKAVSLISRYEKEMIVLYQQNKELEAGLFGGNSLADLDSALINLNYEKVSKVYYIQIMDSEMAVK